ncbi:glutamate formimidoyltransferase [Proteiniclasticum sp.]|uniref:glutamate formimidoyltransferase n=1 Tax=Proteiniclasticum sp. TaxID=2053595 RepID=UPI00289C442A|nr:glutamate formimidoyltransferase [Proteiniclasticum sp.]
MERIVECVPNFSEGRDKEIIEKIVDCFRGKDGVKLLDYSSDKDHNRTVVTLVGEPDAVKEAVISSVKVAKENIDLRSHTGEHPRMGACDVIPFIPIKNFTIEEAVFLSKEVAEEIGKLDIPVFLYERSASAAHRENLAAIRKGQFEGMKEKMTEEKWMSDFGPKAPHESFGVVAVGARMPLVAFNVNLNTSDVSIADAIAKKVRHIGGGLRYVKGMGVFLKDRNIAQVSMNLTDYTKTSIYRALETVRFEAKRYGVSVVGTEIIGLVPQQALIDSVEYYMGIENFTSDQILENKLAE